MYSGPTGDYGLQEDWANILGLPVGYRQPWQKKLADYGLANEMLYGLQGRLAQPGVIGGTGGVGTPGEWPEWVRQRAYLPIPKTSATGNWTMGIQAYRPYESARRLLGSIFGLNPDQREAAATIYEPVYDADTQQMTSRGNIGELQDLVNLALRPQLGGIGAKFFSSNVGKEQERWGQTMAGMPQGQRTSFLDYLKAKYQLDQYGL